MTETAHDKQSAKRRSRARRFDHGVVGALIGTVIGLIWSAIFGPATDGPPSLALSFLVYTTGFALTGFIVASVDWVPPFLGAMTGLAVLSLWAMIVGPKDGWMALWLIVFGGSGLFWGTVIGSLWFAVRDRFADLRLRTTVLRIVNWPAKLLISRHRTWQWYLGASIITLLAVAVVSGAWMLYCGITESMRAENNLHATIRTIRLVEQFVYENGRWPESWDELDRMPYPSKYPSPLNEEVNDTDSYRISELREHVTIDFGADARMIANQDPMKFQAIRPIGPCYEYRDYGYVQSLQETLKKSLAGEKPKKSR